jgi:DNA-binding transcriptional LysR family regulator
MLRVNASERPTAHHLCVRMLRVRGELLLGFRSLPSTPDARRVQRRLSMDLRSTACRFVPDCGNASIPRYTIVDLVVGCHLCCCRHWWNSLVRCSDGVDDADRKIAVEYNADQSSNLLRFNGSDEPRNARERRAVSFLNPSLKAAAR